MTTAHTSTEYHGPTCEQSLAFGHCYHDSCYEVAARYDADRREYTDC